MRSEDRQNSDIFGLVSGIVLVLAALAVGGATVAQEVDALHPRLGDIIVFHRDQRIIGDQSEDLVAVVADAAGVPTQRTCRLQPQTMEAGGGSLIIEARDPSDPNDYRVHWAGGPTSTAPFSCGGSSSLFLSEAALTNLAVDAGGFGITDKPSP
jgi:hypothetical protein